MAETLSALLSRLSKEEQRYISITLKHSGRDSRYLRCYRLLKKGIPAGKISEELGLPERDLSVLKSKLYRRLLDILADFSLSGNIFLQLMRMRERIEVLISKGLFREAEKQVEKLLTKASSHEFYLFEAEALRLKRLLMAQRNYSESKREELLTMKEELQKKTGAFLHLSELQIDSSLLFMQFYREGHLDEESETYQRFLQSHGSDFESNSARFVVHNTRGFLFGLSGVAEGSISEQKMAIDALMQLPAIDNERWYNLVSAFNNICVALCNEGDFGRTKEYLEKLRQLPEKRKGLTYQESIFWWQHILALDFYLMMESAEFKNLDRLLDSLYRALKQYEFSQWYRAYFHYSAAYAALLAGRPDDALQWNLRLLQYPHNKIPKEIHRFALLLQGLIHFELRNYEVASVLLENHRRKLRKMKNSYRLETLFTRFLLRAAKAKECSALASACLSEVNVLLKEHGPERHVLDYVDIDIYLEALSSGMSFSTFYQKKKNNDA